MSRGFGRAVLAAFVVFVSVLATIPGPGPAPAAAADDPSNGLIAFAGGPSSSTYRDFRMYLANPDGTGDVLIIEEDPIEVYNPDWSPDGNKIVYQGGLTGTYAGIWVADADGSNPTQIVSMPYALAPRWSPDGNRIAFWVNFTQNPDNLAIWLVDPDGSNLERIPGFYSVDQQPAWSPDGTKLAYFGAQPDGWGLYTMDVDGTDRTKLTGDTFNLVTNYSGVDWSPDGSYLLFAPGGESVGGPGACAGSNQIIRDIYRIDADGTDLAKVTDTSTWGGPHETHPRFSPDGTRMLYTALSVSCDGGSLDFTNRQVFAADVDGSEPIVQISDFGSDPDDFFAPIDAAVGNAAWQPCTGATTGRCEFVPPTAPQDVTAYAGDGSAFVTWDPPADDGGSPVLEYTVTASPGGQTAVADGLSINAEVAGLTNGTAYTFTVTAANDPGAGPPSAPSNEVTPGAGVAPPPPTGLNGAIAFDRSSSVWVANADGSRQLPTGRGGFVGDWSPDGNRILYWRTNRFYTADIDGGNELLVSNHPDATGSYPRYSPDGSKIVFAGGDGLWALAADGLTVEQLTDGVVDRMPAWSPDGSRIAFVGAAHSKDGWGLYVMDADGSDIRSLTKKTFNQGTGWGGVDWSPDGSQIVFSVSGPVLDPPLGTQCLSNTIDYDLYLIGADGSDLRRLTNTSTWYGPNERFPRFSPDGSALVYSAQSADCVGTRRETTDREVFVTSVEGVGALQVGTSGYAGSEVRTAWQPCGPSTVQCGLPPNQSPAADPGGPYQADDPSWVSLDGSGSSDPDGEITSWAWDFGDGSSGTGSYVSHFYDTPGVYTVELTVADDEGATDTATTTVSIGYAGISCAGLAVTAVVPAGGAPFVGTPNDDVILGTSGADDVSGGGGNDTICGLGGDDVLSGGPGEDLLLGGPGDDVLDGGDDNDKLRGAAGDDTLDGGAGSDRMLPENGNDIVDGGPGSDIVDYLAGQGPVTADLAAGTAVYRPGGDTWTHTLVLVEKVDGSSYADTLSGDWKRNVLRGKQGDDVITGAGGNDDLIGGTGDDRIEGGDGDDLVKGQANDDVMYGGGESDRLVGGSGNDDLFGDAGDDTLIGGLIRHEGLFSNTMDGGAGDDVCRWAFDAQVNC